MKTKKTIAYIMASVIFIAAIIEPISWIIQELEVKEYLERWFPILSTFALWLFALYFVLKSFRYNPCIYTKIVSLIYFFIQTFNLIAYFTQFGIEFYNIFIYPIFVITIMGLILIKIIRWGLSKRS